MICPNTERLPGRAWLIILSRRVRPYRTFEGIPEEPGPAHSEDSGTSDLPESGVFIEMGQDLWDKEGPEQGETKNIGGEKSRAAIVSYSCNLSFYPILFLLVLSHREIQVFPLKFESPKSYEIQSISGGK